MIDSRRGLRARLPSDSPTRAGYVGNDFAALHAQLGASRDEVSNEFAHHVGEAQAEGFAEDPIDGVGQGRSRTVVRPCRDGEVSAAFGCERRSCRDREASPAQCRIRPSLWCRWLCPAAVSARL